MATFKPVSTMSDLDSLNRLEMIEGYMSAQRGDPEPGENRGRSFWHGWRNRMIDMGQLPSDEASRALAAEYMLQCRDQLRPTPAQQEGQT